MSNRLQGKMSYTDQLLSNVVIQFIIYNCGSLQLYTLQWRHNGRDSVSNHQLHCCFLKLLYRRRSTKTSKLRVTGHLCGEFTGHRWMFPFDDVIMSCLNSSYQAISIACFLLVVTLALPILYKKHTIYSYGHLNIDVKHVVQILHHKNMDSPFLQIQ